MKVFNPKLKNLEGITYVKNHGLSTKRTKNYLNCFHALPPGNKIVFISFSVLLHFFHRFTLLMMRTQHSTLQISISSTKINYEGIPVPTLWNHLWSRWSYWKCLVRHWLNLVNYLKKRMLDIVRLCMFLLLFLYFHKQNITLIQ